MTQYTKTVIMLVLATTLGIATAWGVPKHIDGKVTDQNGKPLAGVVMTDGFSVTATDRDGRYALDLTPQSQYVYCSLPADCEVPLRQGSPCFYKKLTYYPDNYNFVLQKRKKGPAKRFNIIFLADPQCQFVSQVNRFRCETVPDMRRMARSLKGETYGVTLGDIGYNEANNTTYLFQLMKGEMEVSKTGFPFFQTIGNHDYEWEPCVTDKHNLTPTMRLQRSFENIFGPLNYSWNCGDAHIVSMNDVIYPDINRRHSYNGDFLDHQVEWLRQDLSHVSKDKLVILCLHIPLYYSLDNANARKVYNLLAEFPNCRVMAGHTHFQHHCVHKNGMEEKVIAAASGAWWWSSLNGDGTPHGYAVTTIDGNRIVNHIYKSTGFKADMQMRLYRGNSKFGGEHETFQLPYSDDLLLANVWNADDKWKIEVYEDGKLSGQMEKAQNHKGIDVNNPVEGNYKDWWAIGYNVGVAGRGHTGGSRPNYCTPCQTMYKYKLHNKQAKVKVVATDRYGNRYTCSDIVSTPDYTGYTPPVYAPDPVWQ